MTSPNLPRLRGGHQALDGIDAQLLVERLHPRGAEAGDVEQRGQPLGNARLDFLERGQVAGVDDLGDLARQVAADARELREVLAPPDIRIQVVGERPDGPRRPSWRDYRGCAASGSCTSPRHANP